MNKQQLASTIWESANQMRSKIEANEYKDFILGFIFYKYISEKEVRFFREQNMSDDDIKEMDESDTQFVEYTKNKIGYFISYENLFSTWLSKGSDFDVSDVRNALSAFDRLISNTHKNVFDGIFKTLQTGLSKLGETATAQTKAIRNLIQLIQKIPMDGRQDYDVLGFIYEYLISMFAANAGKKGGEFYTPHEVSVLMSEIVAEHLQGRKEISIYDPTSGSGSLLINIGEAVSKRTNDRNKVVYYAQEVIENTYNLTRMNLVMRGIEPGNLNVRNGDTLEDDWPFFENGRPETYQYMSVDAVVSNPPYSQKWDTKDKKHDLRFADYGVAPKGKADYAFLLHDLYHLKDDGIMTIVLPHGVLFRGNEEGEIRKNLIEKNKIDAIIGLPENIFFGTPIATIIMVLKKKRTDTDILIIDASKGFEKVTKKNVLRSSDIKRIADVVKYRSEIPGFSVRAKKETIIANEYNLNIPRYIDSSEATESWDIRSIMFGGIPKKEIALLDEYWDALPGLREELFADATPGYMSFTQEDIEGFVSGHTAVALYKENYKTAFDGLRETLKADLIDHYQTVSAQAEEDKITEDIFRRMAAIKVIDPYSAYQVLDDAWGPIRIDLEILQTEGEVVLTAVDPNMVTKKKDDKTYEVQDGWVGRILPFDLVQRVYLTDELQALEQMQAELAGIPSIYGDVMETLEEDDKGVLNDDNNAFVAKDVRSKVDEILEDVETAETAALQKYLTLKRSEKQAYTKSCKDVDWTAMSAGANGQYSKATITARISELKRQHEFPEDSIEYRLLYVLQTMERESQLKKEIKTASAELHNKTKQLIEEMSVEDALKLLEQKWFTPILSGIGILPDKMIDALVAKLTALAKKYQTTFAEVGDRIGKTESKLSGYIGDLGGSTSDMEGLAELQALLGGLK